MCRLACLPKCNVGRSPCVYAGMNAEFFASGPRAYLLRQLADTSGRHARGDPLMFQNSPLDFRVSNTSLIMVFHSSKNYRHPSNRVMKTIHPFCFCANYKQYLVKIGNSLFCQIRYSFHYSYFSVT
jgi:hypothetical protein